MSAQYPTPIFEVNFEDDPIAGYYDLATSYQPTAYWRLDETTGTTAADSSGHGFSGTYTGGYTLNQTAPLGDGNPCVVLNGSSAYVSVPYNATFRDFVPPWTLSAWIYPTAARTGATATSGIITYEWDAGGVHVPFFLAYGQLDYAGVAASTVWGGWLRDSAGRFVYVADPNPVLLNTWHHYVLVADVIDGFPHLSMYRDGVLVVGPARQALAAAPSLSNITTRIGRRWSTVDANDYFPGRIDEPLLIPFALPPTEVGKLFASGAVRRFKDLNFTRIPAIAGQASRVRAFHSRSGRSNNADRVEASDVAVLLDNRDDALTPDPILNLVHNPSFEKDATWWNATNASKARSTTRFQSGAASCQLTSAASGDAYLHSGTTKLTAGLRPGKTYTFSAYVYLATGEGITTGEAFIRIIDEIQGSAQTTTGTTPGGLDAWHRISVTRTIRDDADAAYIRVGFAAGAANEDMWIDSVQVEEAGSVTTYADGDQTDCRWHGPAHNSASHKKATDSYRNILPFRLGRLRAQYGSDQKLPNGGFERGSLEGWTRTAVGTVPDFVEIVVGGDPSPRARYRWRVEGVSITESVLIVSDYIVVDTSLAHVLAAQFYRSGVADLPQCNIRLVCYDQYRRLLGRVYPNQTATGVTRNTAPFNVTASATWEWFGGRYSGQTGTDGGATGGFIAGTRWVQVEIYGANLPVTLVGFVRVDAVQLTQAAEKIADADYASDAYFPIIEGPITSARYRYPGKDFDAVCEVQITDGFRALAGGTLAGLGARDAETVGARVSAVLQAGAVPSDKRSVDTAYISTRLVQAVATGALAGTSPLAYLRSLEETELGLFLITGDGEHVYQGSLYRNIGNRTKAIFTDADVDLEPYQDAEVVYDESNLDNDKTLTNSTFGTEMYANDATSIRRYFPRASSVTSLYDENLVTTRERYEALPRVEPIVLKPASDPSRLWPTVLGLRISDLIGFERSHTRDALKGYLQWVEGIEHDATPGDWTVRLHTSPEIQTGAAALTVVKSGIATPVKLEGNRTGSGTPFFSQGLTTQTYRARRLYVLLVAVANNVADGGAPTITSVSSSTQIRQDVGGDGSWNVNWALFWRLPTTTITDQQFINVAAPGARSFQWCLAEIAYGFDAASPIGVSNTGSNGILDVGTLANSRSVVIGQQFNNQSSDPTWPNSFELHGQVNGPEGYGAAYSPPGSDDLDWIDVGGGDWSNAVEIKAA